MMQFETEIEVEDGLDTSVRNSTLIWGVEFEKRDWGIKSFEVYVPTQLIRYTISRLVGDEEQEIERTLQLDIEKIRLVFSGTEARSYAGLTPLRLEIWKGKMTLFFQL